MQSHHWQHHNTHSKPMSATSKASVAVLTFILGAVLMVQYLMSVWDEIRYASLQQGMLDPGKLLKKEFLVINTKPSLVTDELPKMTHQTPAQTETVEPHYYMVFSTSCTDQQHWESLVFFYHAYKVGQRGNVTRILSGCNPQEGKAAVQFFQSYIQPWSPNFHLHLTPNFADAHKADRQHSYRSSYKYMNKPFGLRHWMENALGIDPEIINNNVSSMGTELANSIVMLLDPDMILLRPMVHDFTYEDVIWVEEKPATKVVRTGFPIGQQDGYLNSAWMKRNISYITNLPPGKFVEPPQWDDGKLHWNSGPPYLATVLAVKWTQYAPRVLELQPDIFAGKNFVEFIVEHLDETVRDVLTSSNPASEMAGFIIACLQLNLPFTFIKSLVISTTETNDREGWPYIDALTDDQVCAPSNQARLPVALHYCKRYVLGRWFFSKYRLKKNILNCEKALLQSPSPGLNYSEFEYGVLPPHADLRESDSTRDERVAIGKQQAKREAFMLCALTDKVNEALLHHKKEKCGRSANLNKTYTVYNDPTNY